MDKAGDLIMYWREGQKKAYLGVVVSVSTEYVIRIKRYKDDLQLVQYKFGRPDRHLDLRWGAWYWKPATPMAKALYED